MAWAVGNLSTVEATGDYVWTLDDDDYCIYPTLIAELQDIAADNPPVVIVRMDHGEPLGILPDNGTWQERPQHGRIGTSAFIVRRDVWNDSHDLWQPLYHGDYLYIDALYDRCGSEWVWWDIVASKTGD